MIELENLLHKRNKSLELQFSSHWSLEYYDDLPVIAACLEGDKKSLSELLSQGENPNETDKKNKSGLHWAAIRGRDDILQILLEKGANVSQVDYLGNTALHYCGHVETIRCLVSFGADLRARNIHDDVPSALMTRRGISNSSLELMEELEQEEDSTDESQQPLLRQKPKLTCLSRNRDPFSMKNVWYEFCTDLGAVRLVMVLLVVLCLSLYVAYLATQLAKKIDTRIPVEDGNLNIEL